MRACASVDSHLMSVVPSIEHLDAAQQLLPDEESVVVQEFIQTAQCVYKVYVVGDAVHVSIRPTMTIDDASQGSPSPNLPRLTDRF